MRSRRSGQRPGYVFYLVECMAESRSEGGLQADLAMRSRGNIAGAVSCFTGPR